MKKILVLAAALTLAVSSCAFALPLVLTEPQKSGGPGVFDTLAARVSAPEQDFTKEELTLDEGAKSPAAKSEAIEKVRAARKAAREAAEREGTSDNKKTITAAKVHMITFPLNKKSI